MENQHREIKGYRELSREEIDLMNRVKAHAETTGELVKALAQMNSLRFKGTAYGAPFEASIANGESNRWAAVAKTQLQQGYMALTRAIALPSTF
jgi:hypothetical protein